MQTTTNRGGIAEIKVLRVSNASDLAMLSENTAYMPTPDDGFAWEELEISEIKEFKHPANTGIGGRIVSFSAIFNHAGYNEEKEATLNYLRDRPVFVYYRTLNDQKHLVEKAYLSFTRIQDPSTSQVSGFEISLKAELNHDIYFCGDEMVIKQPTLLWQELFDSIDDKGMPTGWVFNFLSTNYSWDIVGNSITYSIPKVEGSYGRFFLNKALGDICKGKSVRCDFNITGGEIATGSALRIYVTAEGDSLTPMYNRNFLYSITPGVISFYMNLPETYDKFYVDMWLDGGSPLTSSFSIDYIKLYDVTE